MGWLWGGRSVTDGGDGEDLCLQRTGRWGSCEGIAVLLTEERARICVFIAPGEGWGRGGCGGVGVLLTEERARICVFNTRAGGGVVEG